MVKKSPYFGRTICPKCNYSIKMRKDGSVMNHTLWLDGTSPFYCSGGTQVNKGKTVADMVQEMMMSTV